MAYTKEFLDGLVKAQDVYVWETTSWEKHERGPRWYLWLALAVIALTAYAVFTSNYLFALIVLLTSIILVLAGNQEPSTTLVQIGHNGIVVNGKLYLYGELSDFAMVYHPPETKILYIQPKRFYLPRLRIPLHEEDPVAIRTHLKQYLDEDLDLREEHISDILGRLLRL